jgi:predicted nucleic acid-binding protein
MYLFDTDILSQVLKRNPSPSLLKRLAETPAELQFTSAINAAEVYFGAARVPCGDRILEAFEQKVFPNLTLLPFDVECARAYGPLKARLERKGRTRSEPDLQIAAIALVHRLTVVTGNVRHFEGIPGLRVENWLLP